ncbi:MAG: M23 family metallopeptidase [Rikenellaceae bacterium]|nr:M23 family metallopeptidase [Rikenellaceae bacterium]
MKSQKAPAKEPQQPISPLENASQGVERGITLRLRAYRLIRKLLIGFIVVAVINVLFSNFFLTPKMYKINRDNRELMLKYRILQDRIRTAQRRTDEIRHRDNHVYRTLFSADTLSIAGIRQPYPDEKYAPMADDPFARLMIPTWKQLDQLARSIYEESLSFDELTPLSKSKEQMASSIPAIWPIDRTKLRNGIGAYNPRRFHPILKRIMPHKGVDLGAQRGTPIYATGDAVVEMTNRGGFNGGYGRQVLLNHGFGYKTRYAHMHEVFVKQGDTVRRGDVIGTVGNTGRSTSSHLHYEVLYKGHTVNPVNYFNSKITEEEYERLMEAMQDNTQFESL